MTYYASHYRHDSSLYTRLKALARELNVVLLAPIQSYDDGEYKYSKSIRDHIDIGLNWKRTEEDLKQSRVRFWFTKLRHSKIEIYEGDKDAIEDKTDEDIDYSMRNPVFAKLDTDVMLLDNYEDSNTDPNKAIRFLNLSKQE